MGQLIPAGSWVSIGQIHTYWRNSYFSDYLYDWVYGRIRSKTSFIYAFELLDNFIFDILGEKNIS